MIQCCSASRFLISMCNFSSLVASQLTEFGSHACKERNQMKSAHFSDSSCEILLAWQVAAGHCSARIFGTAGESGCPTKAHGFACNAGRSHSEGLSGGLAPKRRSLPRISPTSCLLRQNWGTGRSNQPELAVRVLKAGWPLNPQKTTESLLCFKQECRLSNLHSSTLISDPVH